MLYRFYVFMSLLFFVINPFLSFSQNYSIINESFVENSGVSFKLDRGVVMSEDVEIFLDTIEKLPVSEKEKTNDFYVLYNFYDPIVPIEFSYDIGANTAGILFGIKLGWVNYTPDIDIEGGFKVTGKNKDGNIVTPIFLGEKSSIIVNGEEFLFSKPTHVTVLFGEPVSEIKVKQTKGVSQSGIFVEVSRLYKRFVNNTELPSSNDVNCKIKLIFALDKSLSMNLETIAAIRDEIFSYLEYLDTKHSGLVEVALIEFSSEAIVQHGYEDVDYSYLIDFANHFPIYSSVFSDNTNWETGIIRAKEFVNEYGGDACFIITDNPPNFSFKGVANQTALLKNAYQELSKIIRSGVFCNIYLVNDQDGLQFEDLNKGSEFSSLRKALVHDFLDQKLCNTNSSNKDFLVFPNPTSSVLYVENNSYSFTNSNMLLIIVDQSGAIKYKKENWSGNLLEVNMETLAAGTYKVQIFNQGSIPFFEMPINLIK